MLLQRSVSVTKWAPPPSVPASSLLALAKDNYSTTVLLRRTLEQQVFSARSVPLPRIMYLEGRWLPGTRKRRFLNPYDGTISVAHGGTPLPLANAMLDDEEAWRSPREPGSHQCIPKAKWQTQSFPNCNSIHEIDVAPSWSRASDSSTPGTKAVDPTNENALSVLGEGWFRTTWRLDRYAKGSSIHAQSVVLKTLRIEREFLSEYYELHRRDAVAMERLTASPFVVNVYGYCGQSAINELADFPFPGVQSLESFNRRMRGKESVKTNSIKLRMAASIALGLADIHAAGTVSGTTGSYMGEGGALMAHYDLNPRNIALFAGGRPKINDFNIAEFLRYNPETNKTCKFPSRLHEPWWRAPEEMNTTHTAWVDENVDVYALGNILFHTLTTHSARGKQHKDRMNEVRPIVAAGIRPVIPAYFRKSKDPNVIAIVKAINLCWSKDPAERASAEEVAAVLYEALVKDRAAAATDSGSDEQPDAAAQPSQDDDAPDSGNGENKEAIGRSS
jgi:serine/threonine protein kinase